MTDFFDVYIPDPACVPGFVQQMAEWGGELFEQAPPRYRHGTLEIELRSTRGEVDRFLPLEALPWRFNVPHVTWRNWEDDRLSREDADSLRGLFAALASCSCWAVLLEYNSGEGAAKVSVAPGELFERIDDLFRAQRESGAPRPGYLVFGPHRTGDTAGE